MQQVGGGVDAAQAPSGSASHDVHTAHVRESQTHNAWQEMPQVDTAGLPDAATLMAASNGSRVTEPTEPLRQQQLERDGSTWQDNRQDEARLTAPTSDTDVHSNECLNAQATEGNGENGRARESSGDVHDKQEHQQQLSEHSEQALVSGISPKTPDTKQDAQYPSTSQREDMSVPASPVKKIPSQGSNESNATQQRAQQGRASQHRRNASWTNERCFEQQHQQQHQEQQQQQQQQHHFQQQQQHFHAAAAAAGGFLPYGYAPMQSQMYYAQQYYMLQNGMNPQMMFADSFAQQLGAMPYMYDPQAAAAAYSAAAAYYDPNHALAVNAPVFHPGGQAPAPAPGSVMQNTSGTFPGSPLTHAGESMGTGTPGGTGWVERRLDDRSRRSNHQSNRSAVGGGVVSGGGPYQFTTFSNDSNPGPRGGPIRKTPGNINDLRKPQRSASRMPPTDAPAGNNSNQTDVSSAPQGHQTRSARGGGSNGSAPSHIDKHQRAGISKDSQYQHQYQQQSPSAASLANNLMRPQQGLPLTSNASDASAPPSAAAHSGDGGAIGSASSANALPNSTGMDRSGFVQNVHTSELTAKVEETVSRAPDRDAACSNLAELLRGWLDEAQRCMKLRKECAALGIRGQLGTISSQMSGNQSSHVAAEEQISPPELEQDRQTQPQSQPGQAGTAAGGGQQQQQLEDDDASTAPFDVALRHSDALELAIEMAMFELTDAQHPVINEALASVLLELMSVYFYGSVNLHRLLLHSASGLSQDAKLAEQEKRALRNLMGMLKHAYREALAFESSVDEAFMHERAQSVMSDAHSGTGSNTVSGGSGGLHKSPSASSTYGLLDMQTFRLTCAAVHSKTLRLAVFRGFRGSLRDVSPAEMSLASSSASGSGAPVYLSDLLHAACSMVEEELYDTIAVAEQEVANHWEHMVDMAEGILVQFFEKMHARVNSLEVEIRATESLSDLREVLRRVTQLCKAHEAVLKYCVEVSEEANKVLSAFSTLFDLISLIYSGLNTAAVAGIAQTGRRITRLCKDVQENAAVSLLIDLLKDTAVNNQSALMGMGNKTARTLRFEESSQRTAAMRARRHARMKSSPDELINLQPRLGDTMAPSSEEGNIADQENQREQTDGTLAAAPELKLGVGGGSAGLDAAHGRDGALISQASPVRGGGGKVSALSTPYKSPLDKGSQHQRSRSVEEIIFIG
ncbi:hypothetical protein FVE85_6613 [Porphyridium purpureum]|uniref:Uncharacterized protein n=1 Tax=Porphyridium purpureum TaxID=35688 RepID=A0A5J4Z738_PORPP|nr:hypothetical protein FVE85_6613 [Porphyridium purpureum]|eukprot:POR5012..scf295_1